MRARLLRGRAGVAGVTVAVAAAVVAAVVSGVATPTPALASPPEGHWVYDRAAGSAFHIDGGTRRVDGRVDAPGAGAVLMTLQGQDRGFLVAADRAVPFGRADLTVAPSYPLPATEQPIGIETIGGPYLVYPSAGTIVRLGAMPTTIQVGGPVGSVTNTDVGAVWVRRTDNGGLCRVLPGTDTAPCPAATPPAHHGGLTITGNSAAFVDTDDDTVVPLGDSGAALSTSLGTNLPTDAMIAAHDVGSRIAAITPSAPALVLVGPSPAVTTVPLPAGTYAPPVASPTVVAVLETTRGILWTYGPDGRQLGRAELGPEGARALLSRGADGNLYVDDPTGGRTHVVGADGSIIDVRTSSDAPVAAAAPAALRVSVRPPPFTRVTQQAPTAPGPPPPGGGGATSSPGGGGGTVPPPGGGAGPTPCGVPGAPTGLTADADGTKGTVTARWGAATPAGCPVISYTMAVNGTNRTVTATTATVPAAGLTPGQTETVVVRASSQAGAGAPAQTTVTPLAPAAAPTGLDRSVQPCNVQRLQAGGAYCYPQVPTVSWVAPNLNGGELDHYVVSVVQGGRTTATKNTTTTSAAFTSASDFQQCELVTFTVAAFTRPVGSPAAQLVPGATASRQFEFDQCGASADAASATANADGSVTVTIYAYYAEQIGATCTISFSGTQKWTGPCPTSRRAPYNDAKKAVVITGLTPATTYTVAATASNRYGTASGATVQVTTG